MNYEAALTSHTYCRIEAKSMPERPYFFALRRNVNKNRIFCDNFSESRFFALLVLGVGAHTFPELVFLI